MTNAKTASLLFAWGRPCLLVLAALLAFSPAFRGEWLWDDNLEITQNPALHAPDGLAAIWLRPASPDPLKQTVEWLGHGLWGDSPEGFHLLGFAGHLAGAFLVWRLFAALGLRWAWAGALLFAIHPLAVESVAWIAELKNTISLPFYLLSLLAYVVYAERGRRRDWALSLLAFAAALLCKASTAMLPAVVALYVWWKRGALTRRDAADLAPFVALAAAMTWLVVRLQADSIALAPGTVLVGGWPSRLANAGLIASFYLGKFVLPVALAPIYPKWSVDPPSLAAFAPCLMLGALLVWFWRRRAGWGRHALLASGFFLLNLVPVLGLVPLAYFRLSWVADHLAYLSLIGLAGGAAAWTQAARGRVPFPVLATGTAVVLAALAIGSRACAAKFTGQEILWTHNVALYPDAWMAQNNLGVALMKRGRLDAAAARYGEALRLDPECEEAHNNLGVVLARQGRRAEAAAQFQAALAINPHYPSPRRNLEGFGLLPPPAP